MTLVIRSQKHALVPLVCRHHQRLEECSCEILLFLGSLEEQVCHDGNVPDHLGGWCASGDVHIDLDQVTNRQVCLMCRLVLLATAGRTG